MLQYICNELFREYKVPIKQIYARNGLQQQHWPAIPCSQALREEPGALPEVPSLGQPPHVARVDVEVGGVTAEPGGAHHPLPRGEVRVRAGLGDDPRELETRRELALGGGTAEVQFQLASGCQISADLR